jgi:hypothetical protein
MGKYSDMLHGSSIFIFLVLSILFSIVTMLIYIATNSVRSFAFLHDFTDTAISCSFDNSFSNWGEMVSPLHYWLTFSWWLWMLVNFSLICWPFICPFLGKISIQILWTYFNQVVFWVKCLIHFGYQPPVEYKYINNFS